MTRIVYGAPPSPFVRKVLISLHEMDLSFEMRPLMPLPKTPELRALNPLEKIPIYQEGDLTLPDSSVICAYLAKSEGDARLYPSAPADFGRALFYEEYADTAMADALGGLFFQLFVRKHVMQEEPDEALVASLWNEAVPSRFDYLEHELEGDYLAGDFSIADVAVGAQLQALTFLQREIDGDRWPRLTGYFARLMSRPSFQKAMG